MAGLLETGELPKLSRGSGRKRGIWAGHEALADELRTLAKREPARWGMVLTGVKSSKAQVVATAVTKGTASGYEPDFEGKFVAHSRKSKNQDNAPKNARGEDVPFYDVWARYVLTGPAS